MLNDNRKMADDLDKLDSQIYNLCLYMDYVRENHPEIYQQTEIYFDGLPGYVPVKKDNLDA